MTAVIEVADRGIDPRLEYLGIMAAWVIAASGLAARFFRWDNA